MGRTSKVMGLLVASGAVLVGCGSDGGGDEAATPTTTAPATTATTLATTTTSTTRPVEAIKAALLTPADVPGSKLDPEPGEDSDFSSCFPGNPLAAKTDPSEVEVPDLTTGAAGITSAARQGKREDAASFVTTLTTQAGADCMRKLVEAEAAKEGATTNLTATGSKVSVGDAGALLRFTGTLSAGGQSTSLEGEIVAFHEGGVLVLVNSVAVGESLAPTVRAEALATKVAGRL